jgi:hypothetical protein
MRAARLASQQGRRLARPDGGRGRQAAPTVPSPPAGSSSRTRKPSMSVRQSGRAWVSSRGASCLLSGSRATCRRPHIRRSRLRPARPRKATRTGRTRRRSQVLRRRCARSSTEALPFHGHVWGVELSSKYAHLTGSGGKYRLPTISTSWSSATSATTISPTSAFTVFSLTCRAGPPIDQSSVHRPGRLGWVCPPCRLGVRPTLCSYRREDTSQVPRPGDQVRSRGGRLEWAVRGDRGRRSGRYAPCASIIGDELGSCHCGRT